MRHFGGAVGRLATEMLRMLRHAFRVPIRLGFEEFLGETGFLSLSSWSVLESCWSLLRHRRLWCGLHVFIMIVPLWVVYQTALQAVCASDLLVDDRLAQRSRL